MTPEERNLIQQLIDEARLLNASVSNYTTTIDDKIAELQSNAIDIQNNLSSSIQEQIDGVYDLLPTTPNFLIDTAEFSLFCNGQKGLSRDYFDLTQRGTFLRGLTLELNSNVDDARSSLKATVINTMNLNGTPEASTGVMFNGDLQDYSNYSGSSRGQVKSVLVLDYEVYLKPNAATNSGSLQFNHLGCNSQYPNQNFATGLVNRINNNVYCSSFYQLISDNAPTLASNEWYEFRPVGGTNGLRHVAIRTDSTGVSYTRTPKGAASNVVTTGREGMWNHVTHQLGDAAIQGCPSAFQMAFFGERFKTTPVKFKIAITLPYVGFGNFLGRPVWASEAEKVDINDLSSSNRYPFGIKY